MSIPNLPLMNLFEDLSNKSSQYDIDLTALRDEDTRNEVENEEEIEIEEDSHEDDYLTFDDVGVSQSDFE